MAWKDVYSESFTNREILLLEIIEKYVLENRGQMPSISELVNLSNLNTYQVTEGVNALIEKQAILNINEDGKEKRILKGSRLLGKSEGIYKKVPGVFKGKLQIKTALIPHIKTVKNIEDIFAKENIREYVAVPVDFNREENLFAFNIPKKGLHSALNSLNIGNIGIVDTKSEYLSGDYVAKIDYEDKIIYIDEYYIYKERTNEDKDKYKILGKVIGAYKIFSNIF